MVTPNCDCHRTTMWRTKSSTARQSSPPLDMGLIAGTYFHLRLILMALFDKILEIKKNVKGKFWAPHFSQHYWGPGLHKIISWWKWLWGHATVTSFIPLPFCVHHSSLNLFCLCTCLSVGNFQLVASFSSMGCKVKQNNKCPCSFGISAMPPGWKLNQGYIISPFFSFSSQREEDGERRKKQKTFDFGQAKLPRYTAMDAVGWVGLLLISPGNCNVFPNLTENPNAKVL